MRADESTKVKKKNHFERGARNNLKVQEARPYRMMMAKLNL